MFQQRRWQRQANASTNWSEWASLGGAVLPGLAVGKDENAQFQDLWRSGLGAGNGDGTSGVPAC
jgi:hypothetical protein